MGIHIWEGTYPFRGVKLNRADVEWLLAATAKSGEPSAATLDLRGADLRKVDLTNLPLAGLRAGLDLADWQVTEPPERTRLARVWTWLRWGALAGAAAYTMTSYWREALSEHPDHAAKMHEEQAAKAARRKPRNRTHTDPPAWALVVPRGLATAIPHAAATELAPQAGGVIVNWVGSLAFDDRPRGEITCGLQAAARPEHNHLAQFGITYDLGIRDREKGGTSGRAYDVGECNTGAARPGPRAAPSLPAAA